MTSELSESPNKYESSSRQYVDIIVILCLAVLPSMYRSFMIVGNGSRWAESTFTQLMLALIVSSIQIAAPILLIMHLRKVVWSDHGFVSCRPIRDVLVGVGLMVASYLAYYLCAYGLLFAGQNFTADTNGLSKMTIEASLNHSSLVLILIASAANSFTEELAMRSYLIPRLTDLTGSPAFAVITTSVLFASYHSYQGRYGVISALFVGLILGTYFLKAKRFWPIVIAHFFMDAIPLAMIAASGGM